MTMTLISETSTRITNLCCSYQPLASTLQTAQSTSTMQLSFAQQQQLQDLRHEQRVLHRLFEYASSPAILSCSKSVLDMATSKIAGDNRVVDYGDDDDDMQVARSYAILEKHALLRRQEQRERLVTICRRLQALRLQTRHLQQQQHPVRRIHRQTNMEEQQQHKSQSLARSNSSNQESSSQRNKRVKEPDKSVGGTPLKVQTTKKYTTTATTTTAATALPVNVHPAAQAASQLPHLQQLRLQQLQREHAILQGILTDLISCHVPDWNY